MPNFSRKETHCAWAATPTYKIIDMARDDMNEKEINENIDAISLRWYGEETAREMLRSDIERWAHDERREPGLKFSEWIRNTEKAPKNFEHIGLLEHYPKRDSIANSFRATTTWNDLDIIAASVAFRHIPFDEAMPALTMMKDNDMDKWTRFVDESDAFNDFADSQFGGLTREQRDDAAFWLAACFSMPFTIRMEADDDMIREWLAEYPDNPRELIEHFDASFEGTMMHEQAMAEMLANEREAARTFVEKSGLDIDIDDMFHEMYAANLWRENLMAVPNREYLERLASADFNPDECIDICSSNGNLYADRNGNVTAFRGDWLEDPELTDIIPLKIDVREYEQYWGETISVPTEIDILDLGFAASSGKIEKAEDGWREEAKALQEEERKADMRP